MSFVLPFVFRVLGVFILTAPRGRYSYSAFDTSDDRNFGHLQLSVRPNRHAEVGIRPQRSLAKEGIDVPGRHEHEAPKFQLLGVTKPEPGKLLLLFFLSIRGSYTAKNALPAATHRLFWHDAPQVQYAENSTPSLGRCSSSHFASSPSCQVIGTKEQRHEANDGDLRSDFSFSDGELLVHESLSATCRDMQSSSAGRLVQHRAYTIY